MTVATTAQRRDDLTRVAEELGVFVFNDAGEVVGIDDLSVPPRPSRRSRFARRLLTWARNVVRAASEALAWLARPVVELCARHRINRQGVFYRPRHGVRRAWYGVRRSSASTIRTRRCNVAREADSEPALPEHFVSYISLVIETMRGHEDALHPRAGFQYRC